MNFQYLFDLPTAILVLSGILIAFIATNGLRSSLMLARDISIPIGICGTLLGVIMMLGSLDDPSTIYSAIGIALVSSCYGLLQFMFLHAIVNRLDPIPHVPPKNKRAIAAIILFALIVLSTISIHSNISFIIDSWSILMVLLGSVVLAVIEKRDAKSRLEALGKYGVLTAFLAVSFSLPLLIQQLDDPTAIGPAIAIGLCSLLYGGLLYITASILYHAKYGESLPSSKESTAIFGFVAITFIGVFCYFMTNLLYNWALQEDIQILQKNKTEQDALLRQLAPNTAGNSKSGLLTVSSDKDSWVFVDDKLIGQAPLYQMELSAGEHFVQIASCPNIQGVLYQTETEINYIDYWQGASDGSCDEPSQEEIETLIAAGKIKEIVLSGDNGIQQISHEYSPELNFCCDDNLTKAFTVHLEIEPLVYVWSFEQNSWILDGLYLDDFDDSK